MCGTLHGAAFRLSQMAVCDGQCTTLGQSINPHVLLDLLPSLCLVFTCHLLPHPTPGLRTLQLELLAQLVRAGELSWQSVWHVYALLLEDSRPVRAGAAALVSQVLPELGRVHLQQVVAAAAPTPGNRRPDAQAKTLDPESASEAELQLAGLVHVLALMAADEAGAVQQQLAPPGGGMAPGGGLSYEEDGVPPLCEADAAQVVGALADR